MYYNIAMSIVIILLSQRSYIASFYIYVSASWRKYKAARLRYKIFHVFRELTAMMCTVGNVTSREFVVFQKIIGR
jgi:hypothetical protein